MIVDERMVTFINSLTKVIQNSWKAGKRSKRRCGSYCKKGNAELLKFLMAAARPKRILEVGTAVGFSALLMCEYNPEPCQIITIENYEKRIQIARDNFKKRVKRARSNFWREMQQRFFPRSPNPLILFLWMQPKDSIFIFTGSVATFKEWRPFSVG